MTPQWLDACRGMTQDVAAVTKALLDAGVSHITVKDFHRTGYNIIPEGLDPRVRLVQGYRQGPVPGIGSPGDARAVMYLGLHAASGTDGFLAHTLTSRIEKLTANGEPLAEVQLFSAALSPYGIRPIFFSGCPLACLQAEQRIPGLASFAIDKSSGRKSFQADCWRADLAESAQAALENTRTEPYAPSGPFEAVVTMREGKRAAAAIAARWGYAVKDSRIFLRSHDLIELFHQLIRLCYLRPWVEKFIRPALYLYNLRGRWGLYRAKQMMEKKRAI